MFCFEKLSINFKCHENLKVITGTLHEDQNTFLIISRSILLRMRNVSDKSCRENRNTHFVFNSTPPSPPKMVPFMRQCEKKCRAGQATDDNITRRMRICMLDTYGYRHTHPEYVTLTAFPSQQWLHERASLLRCTYTACLVWLKMHISLRSGIWRRLAITPQLVRLCFVFL